MPSSTLHTFANPDGTANGFKMPRAKALPRPTTWFTQPPSDSMAMRNTPLGPTSSSSSSGSNQSLSSASGSIPFSGKHTFTASPGNPFAIARNPKHRLSPTPSPHKDEDFVMISPITAGRGDMSSSPIEESPTPACGMANAAARLRLGDEESPIRKGSGSRLIPDSTRKGHPPSPLKFGTGGLGSIPMSDGEESPGFNQEISSSPIPQPLFPLPRSHSQELRATRSGHSLFGESKIPRLSASHPLRARASTGSQMDQPTLGSSQKKTISLDRIQSALGPDEAFGSMPAPAAALGHARRTSKGTLGPSRHRRGISGEHSAQASISRSAGHKSGLALSLGGLPDFSYSNSSLSSLSTNNMTPPLSTFAPNEPPIFEDIKPLQEAFEQPSLALHKFKPRDSGVSVGEQEDRLKVVPGSVLRPTAKPRRPPMLKRTSSMGDQRPLETPIEPAHMSGWPSTQGFTFLGEGGMSMGIGGSNREDEKMEMPGTPVKRNHAKRGMGHSSSQPSLGSGSGSVEVDMEAPTKGKMPPPTMRKKSGTMGTTVPSLTLNGSSSSPDRGGQDSPTIRVNGGLPTGMMSVQKSKGKMGRVGLLGNTGSGSESDGTPTKGGGEKVSLASTRPDITTPSKPSQHQFPTPALGSSSNGIYPRLSLPAFANPKIHRTLYHRQSHPATKAQIGQQEEEENIFESKFILLDTLGKGAFSTVFKVQDRHGEGVWAVKKARGVFDGVRDRLRHLEEVDILSHLSNPPSPHVIQFQSAWEQNRQLFIQTELCLGSLAFFLEEYGRVVERLDEGRVWKIIRELGDGINHIHSAGVVHFDLKPANILISDIGTLKIGDFGMASRVPRISPARILEGSGLAGDVGTGGGGGGGGTGEIGGWEKIEREGDRVYMPPEMLRGVFVPAADLFSFGLIILEVSTNICVPDGGPAWHSLRTDDFTVVDLSPLSPALADLITNCMNSNPDQRPTSLDVVGHPVIQRARTGGAALAPESREWLGNVLGGFGYAQQSQDVEMGEA